MRWAMKQALLLPAMLLTLAARPAANSTDLSTMDTSYWQTQSTGITGSTLFAISTVNRNVCWLAGASGTIIRTTDAGNIWSLINSGIIGTRSIYTLEGVSDSIAFASTTLLDGGTFLYRTTNAGSSWEQVFSQTEGFIFGIKMLSPTVGLTAGDPEGGRWTILKTTNGGANWYRIASEPPQIGGAGGGTRFGTFDTSYVWFFDNAGRQYWSADGGETWTYGAEPGSGTLLICWNRDYHSQDPAALSVTADQVFQYHHGWVVAGPTPSFPVQPTALVGALWTNDYWLVQGTVYYTPDAGNSWTNMPPNGLNKHVGLIDMATLGSEVSAWATSIGDTLYHHHRIITAVDGGPQPLPMRFFLSQNFPNPFNPATTIGYQIPQGGLVKLTVYDVLGSKVTTLVDAVQAAGNHTVEWKADGVSSGIYVYRLDANGRTTSRKMLLLR